MDSVIRLRMGTIAPRFMNRPLRGFILKRNRYRLCSKEDPGVDLEDEAEERIARLEAAAKGRSSVKEVESEEDSESKVQKREWKKGEPLPEGWKDLSAGQKAWELYAGERGALYWANRVALIAAIVLGVTWIFFRFVGPILGLYELKSTFSS